MRVADYILKRLAVEGIDTAFMVYGGAMAELADAFLRQNEMRYVCAQHEQGAIFMAEGYAKTKGVPGVVIVTSGPGVGNIVTGLQNAHYDSTPLIVLAGQVATRLLRPVESELRQRGFQETPAADIARPVTKWALTVKSATSAVVAIEGAISLCRTERPGPVLLDLPSDVQRAEL
jgi:acetolactate synthase-1/2/3 large subunit